MLDGFMAIEIGEAYAVSESSSPLPASDAPSSSSGLTLVPAGASRPTRYLPVGR